MRLTGPQGVVLRPLKRADAEEFAEVRVANRDWLQPWDATLPGAGVSGADARGGASARETPGSDEVLSGSELQAALREERAAFHSMRRVLQSQARQGVALPFALEVDGRFRGQVTAVSIQWGSISSVQIGYWIDSRLAGRGLMPLAVAMATDACFFDLGLHRVEINIRPENSKSLRVVEKLGFRFEGVRRGYMHIAGKWADHRSYALLSDEVPTGLTNAYIRDRGWGSGGCIGP